MFSGLLFTRIEHVILLSIPSANVSKNVKVQCSISLRLYIFWLISLPQPVHLDAGLASRR